MEIKKEATTKDWLLNLPEKLSNFVLSMRDGANPGFYRYSYSGDVVDNSLVWGLGNSIFATKILYMLDLINEDAKKDLSNFIVSFQDAQGYIFDSVIQKKSRLNRYVKATKTLDFNNICNEQTRRAETRQAFAALRCLGAKSNIPYFNIPSSREEIKKFIEGLDWKNPWGAGSHVSHLLFFLYSNYILFDVNSDKVEELISYVLNTINRHQQADGGWYERGEDVPTYQKINGAMKILTAYEACERNSFSYTEKLIDLCLSTVHDGNACNNLNVIYVLYRCSLKTEYKADEIRDYCIRCLDIYKRHYWSTYGGFSFYERRANDVYYGARISKGLPEPDIHGTVLFLWGIALISHICDLAKVIKLKIPIT